MEANEKAPLEAELRRTRMDMFGVDEQNKMMGQLLSRLPARKNSSSYYQVNKMPLLCFQICILRI